MKTISFLASLTLGLGVASHGVGEQLPTKPIRLAQGIMCFKTGEESPPGFTKICYYDCLGSRVAITISSTALCPLSIQR